MTVGPTPPPGDWKVDGEELLLNPNWVPDAEPEEVAAAPVLAPATTASVEVMRENSGASSVQASSANSACTTTHSGRGNP
jgi:hypothetical protein